MEIGGTNPKGTVHFLRLIRKVEAPQTAEPGPGTIMVVRAHNTLDYILLDGKWIPNELDVPKVVASGVSFNLPSRGTMRAAASRTLRLTNGGVYVLIYEAYNSRLSPSVVRTVGLKELFSYGDGHGGKWVAFFRVIAETWQVDWDVPGHHSHGWHSKRVGGTLDGFEWRTDQRALEEASQV